jgi:uncharacterized protein YndB with AHSA1/START domain
MVTGKIVGIDPGKRLSHTFDFTGNKDAPSHVKWDIEEMVDVSKFTVTHVFEAEGETYQSTQNGWPPLLSGLKTLLETGEALRITKK